MSTSSSSSSTAAPDQARSIEARLQALEAEVQFLRNLVFGLVGVPLLILVVLYVPAVWALVYLLIFAAVVVIGVMAVIRTVQFLLSAFFGPPST